MRPPAVTVMALQLHGKEGIDCPLAEGSRAMALHVREGGGKGKRSAKNDFPGLVARKSSRLSFVMHRLCRLPATEVFRNELAELHERINDTTPKSGMTRPPSHTAPIGERLRFNAKKFSGFRVGE